MEMVSTKTGAFLSGLHRLLRVILEGGGEMENHDEEGRDVDDLIFEGEPWQPSQR
jgi:hypothetical protein